MEPLYEIAAAPRKASRRHWLSSEMMEACLEQSRSELGRNRPIGLSNLQSTLGDTSLQSPQPVAGALDPGPVVPSFDLNTTAGRNWPVTDEMDSMTGASLDDGDLLAISESLMDHTFTDVNRIVTLDDMMLGGFPEITMNWELS